MKELFSKSADRERLQSLGESNAAKWFPHAPGISLVGVFSKPRHKDLEPQWKAAALLNGKNRESGLLI